MPRHMRDAKLDLTVVWFAANEAVFFVQLKELHLDEQTGDGPDGDHAVIGVRDGFSECCLFFGGVEASRGVNLV